MMIFITKRSMIRMSLTVEEFIRSPENYNLIKRGDLSLCDNSFIVEDELLRRIILDYGLWFGLSSDGTFNDAWEQPIQVTFVLKDNNLT